MSLTKLRELMVLNAVRAHPAHGYAVAELLAHGLGPTLGLTRPTVYATLSRLERRGWLRSETVRDGAFPEREVYHLLDEGDDAYPRLLADCVAADPGAMMPIVALLSHLDDLPERERRPALERLRKARTDRVERLEALPPHSGAAGIAVRLMLEHLRLDVAALEDLLRSPAGVASSSGPLSTDADPRR